MKSTFLIALTLLILGSSVAYSKIIKSKITTDSFVTAPVAVIDPTKDSLFADATPATLFFSAGKSNDTLYAWSVIWDVPSNSSTALIRKSFDALTLAEKDSALSINASIKSKIGLTGEPGIGFIGFVALRDAGNDTAGNDTAGNDTAGNDTAGNDTAGNDTAGNDTADNLFFDVLAADADENTAPTEVQITNNSDTTISYFDLNVWWQDDYFYVLYVQVETAKGYEKALYLQAVKGADASLLWKSPVKITTLNNPPTTAWALAGANKPSGADTILVAWKDNDSKAVMQTTVTISNGKVDDPTTLVSDTDKVMYFPDGIISASSVYGLIIDKQTLQDQKPSDDLKVYYNGTTSKPSDLDLTAPKDYTSPIIKPFDNSAGFTVIAQYFGKKEAKYVLRVFGTDGSEQGDQKTLIKTVSNMHFFTDISGAIWLGYADFSSDDGKVSTGYLGKVLA